MKHKTLLQRISKASLFALIGATMLNFYIAPPARAAGPNLINNPSMETANGTSPQGWANGFFPGDMQVSFTYPVEGSAGPDSKAAKVEITNYPGEGDAKWYFQDVPVSPQTYYIFSNKYKATVPTKVYVRYNLGNDVYSHVVLEQIAASAEWAPVLSEFLTPPGVVSLTIFHVLESAGSLTVDDYSLATKDNPDIFDSGIFTFTFDDGWQSVYDNAIPILDAKGYKSTQYIITDVVQEQREGSYMTPAEVLAMHNSGHDIAAHTRTHTSLALPPLSATELAKEVSGSRLDLLTRLKVKPADTLAYTYGDYDEAAKAAVRDAGFIGARTIDVGYNEKISDRYTLKSMSILKGGIDPVSQGEVPTTSIEEVKAAIDNAITNKAWLIFTLHQTDNDANNVYGTTPEFLQQMVDYIAEKQGVVKTMSETLRMMPGVPAKDTTPPVVADMPDMDVAATSPEGAVVTFQLPTVTDNVDTNLKAYAYTNSNLTSGSTFPIGSTEVSYRAMDSSGNLSQLQTFTINVADPAAPTVTLNAPASPTKLRDFTFNFSSNDPAAILTYSLDGAAFQEATSTVSVTNLAEGAHTFTVRATDSENRVGSATARFTIDLTKPVITMTGNATTTIAVGAGYTDPGATAQDSVDGAITVTVSGDTVSTSTPSGTYRIHYDASDKAGNAADRVSRTVIVGDGTGTPDTTATDITSNSITIRWNTTASSTGAVVWDKSSHTTASSTAAGPEKYGYTNWTSGGNDPRTTHSVKIDNLDANTTYYFRTVSTAGTSTPILGNEISAKTNAAPSGGGGYIPSTPPTYYGQAGHTGSIAWNGNEVGGNGNGHTDFMAEARIVSLFNGDITLTPANQALYNNLVGTRVVTEGQRKAISFFIQNGTDSSRKLGAGERAGVLNSFLRAFERLPLDEEDWEDVIKVAAGRWTKKINQKAEQNAMAIFSVIYRRQPNLDNVRDQTAVKLIAYGLRPGNRNVNSERASLKTFFSVFNRLPRLAGDWDIVRAIAYSGAKR